MKEIWKDIPDYEGFYQVSNLGNILSLNYKRTKRPRLKKPTKHNTGYMVVVLYANKKHKQYLVHDLVMETFSPDKSNFKSMPCEDRCKIDLNKLEINHKDENKLNNNLDNLEWCTRKYNSNYGTRISRVIASQCKQVLQYDLRGNFIKSWESVHAIDRELNIPEGNISACCLYKRKTAGGYIWRYTD